MTNRNLELKVIIAAVDRFVRPMKNITEASRTASKALSGAKAAMKELNDQQKLVDRFKLTDKSLGINTQDLEKARIFAKKLGEEMHQAEKPTVAMQRAFKKATDDARNLAGTVNRLREQKQRLRGELVGAGIDTKALASHQRDLKAKIDAATAAVNLQDEALKKVNKRKQLIHAAEAEGAKMRGFGAKASAFGRGSMAVGAAAGAAMSVPVLAYARAEEASTDLKVAMMKSGGEVAAEFKQIDELAKRLGNKLPGTTADYQNMMSMLIRQGMSAENILGGLGEATAYMSVQLKMTPDAAAEFSSKLQDATRTVDKDMMSLMDTIQRTTNLGVDKGNLLQGFAKLSPALSILKKDGAAAAAALAPLLVMTDQSGMEGGAAGNAYRKIFQQAMNLDKRKNGNEALKGTGVSLDFSNGKGEFGGLDKMFAQLEKLRRVTTEKRLSAIKAMFGDDAETLQALTLMIEKGKAGYNEVQAKLAAQASLQERVNAQLQTLTKLWDAASGTFTNALVTFGESISPELHATAEWLGTVAGRVQKWADENPELSRTLMTVLKWAGLIALGIGGIALAIGAVAVPLAIMNTALASLGFAGALSATGLLAGKLGLLAGAFGVGYFVGGIFNDFLNQSISKIVGYDTSLGSLLYDLVESFKSTDWSMLGQWIVQGIEKGLDSLTFGLYSKVQQLASGIATAAKEALGINSPSRVFAEIGGYTMQGLEQGIEGGQRAPLTAISSVARKVAALGAGAALLTGGAMANQSSIDTRPPSFASQSAGGNTFIFNIHPSQGMDERALAAAIKAEFSRIASAQGARERSRLRDTE